MEVVIGWLDRAREVARPGGRAKPLRPTVEVRSIVEGRRMDLDREKVVEVMNEILELELAGTVRLTQ